MATTSVSGPVESANGFTVNGTTVINANGEIVADIKDTLAQGSIYIGNASNVTSELDVKTSGQILVGNGTTATSVAVSGDATLSSAGALTIANNAITAAKTADASGVAGLYVQKYAIMVYDFSVDGGATGTITPTNSPTLPDNAIVLGEQIAIDVLTTFTSGTDAGQVSIGFATDGDIVASIAIDDVSSPWGAGLSSLIGTKLKLTAARQMKIDVSVEALTAGKMVVYVPYLVSQ